MSIPFFVLDSDESIVCGANPAEEKILKEVILMERDYDNGV